MKLSSKHQKQRTITKADFTGGLNTATNVDGIGENQLADCLNVEVDRSTGRLKTVSGTKDILTFRRDPIGKIFAAIYDEINKVILLVTDDKTVFKFSPSTSITTNVGKLTGTLYPICQSWEDGVLIASGGKLQYFHNNQLETIDSPTANTVFVRAGRVLINDSDNIHFSGVGDETQWTEETNDDSTAKFVEVGYKDGGKIIGFLNLYDSVLIIKDNRRVYRLQGEYPDWTISEVSRNVECSGRLSFCSIADQVFILGKNEFQNLSTMTAYGDLKPTNAAQLIISEIRKLPVNSLVRFVPPLNQIWILNSNNVLIFDLNFNSWYKRQFNSPIIDVVSIGNDVYIIKPDRISILDENSFYDNKVPLQWQFIAQRLISQYDFLLKRSQISIVPFDSNLYSGLINVGAVKIPLPIPNENAKIAGSDSMIRHNYSKVNLAEQRRYLYTKDDKVYDNDAPLLNNDKVLYSRQTYIKMSKQIFRSKFLDICGQGSGGGFLLNSIMLDVVEV